MRPIPTTSVRYYSCTKVQHGAALFLESLKSRTGLNGLNSILTYEKCVLL